MIGIDGSPDRAWELAGRSIAFAGRLLDSVPLVADASLRAEPLSADRAAAGRLARSRSRQASSLPLAPAAMCASNCRARARLTLAEVEVVSGGRNVARQGRATQKNTATAATPAGAIDGNTSGDYGDGGQTHSEENTDKPWWEVDLGASVPIESIVVYNRTEGDLGRRLDGFTLIVLDENRQESFRQDRIEAPREQHGHRRRRKRTRP